MDIQEHDTQVRDALARVDRDLKSLRLTFGIVLIILTVLLAVAAPTIVRPIWNSLMGSTEEVSATVEDSRPVVTEEPAPAAVATTTATAASTTAATTTKP